MPSRASAAPSAGHRRVGIRSVALLVLALPLVAGCARRETDSSRTDVGNRDSLPPATAPRESSLAAEAPAGAFVDDGVVLRTSGAKGDAVQVASLVSTAAGEATRLVIAFARGDGEPASTVGPVTVEHRRALRVVRVRLPAEVQGVAVSERSLAEPLVRGAFVVRALGPERALFVDLHLDDRPSRVRASLRSHPAALVLELAPGGPPVAPLRFSRGPRGNAVVLSPVDERQRYPLVITGYTRGFEATVVARLRAGGAVVAETSATAADWTETWGEYRLAFRRGPLGPVRLEVEGSDPRDDAPPDRGVALDLTLER